MNKKPFISKTDALVLRGLCLTIWHIFFVCGGIFSGIVAFGVAIQLEGNWIACIGYLWMLFSFYWSMMNMLSYYRRMKDLENEFGESDLVKRCFYG